MKTENSLREHYFQRREQKKKKKLIVYTLSWNHGWNRKVTVIIESVYVCVHSAFFFFFERQRFHVVVFMFLFSSFLDVHKFS